MFDVLKDYKTPQKIRLTRDYNCKALSNHSFIMMAKPMRYVMIPFSINLTISHFNWYV